MFCTKCGSSVQPGTAFCGACGNPVSPTGVVAPSAFPAQVQPSELTPYPTLGGVVVAQSPTYAGFWLRFLAHIIDSLILTPVFLVLYLGVFVLMGGAAFIANVSKSLGNPAASQQAQTEAIGGLIGLLVIVGLVALLISWLYNAYFESGEKQATWGKQVLGLYVTDLNGHRMTFGRASGRFFAKIVSGMIPLGIGYIMAGFTERKQALHDMIAATLVLKH